MSIPKVSVITPAYNSADFIGLTITSVLNQTYPDYEIVIVDDGSKDQTRAIAKSYADEHSDKIRIFTQDNAGSGAARNRGIKESQGSWIAFLDADDIWLPQKLDRQMKYLTEHADIDGIFSNAVVINEKGLEIGHYLTGVHETVPDRPMLDRLLLKNIIPFSSFVIKKDALSKIGFFDESIQSCEDYDLVLKLSKQFKLYYLPENLILYRRSPNNKSSNLEGSHRSTLEILHKHTAGIKNFSHDLKSRFAVYYYEWGYSLFAKESFADARKAFVKSMRYNTIVCPQKYIYFFLALLPQGLINRLRSVRRKLHDV